MAEKLVALGLPDWRTAYACALNTLYQLDAEHLQRVAPLANLLTSRKSLSICIHVRAGDEYLRNASAAQADLAEVLLWTESYFDCAQEIERQHLQRGQAPVWYLASDNGALRDAMRHHFPDKLVRSVWRNAMVQGCVWATTPIAVPDAATLFLISSPINHACDSVYSPPARTLNHERWLRLVADILPSTPTPGLQPCA